MLNHLPNILEIGDEDERACCAACECFSCVYLMDIFCTVPTMRAIEKNREERYSLLNLPFYEVCWPCMCVASNCGVSKETLQGISAIFKLPCCFSIFNCFKDDPEQ